MSENVNESDTSLKQEGSLLKIVVMFFFIIVDLGLNSFLDYDKFNDKNNNHSNATHLLLGLCGLQIVIEISIFLILFMSMADTFLFRVGLLGLLIKKFKLILIIHPLYIAITLITGLYRVRMLGSGLFLTELWGDEIFFYLSTLQKIVAVPYYALNIRASFKLTDPIFFDKSTWVNLVKQYKKRDQIKSYGITQTPRVTK